MSTITAPPELDERDRAIVAQRTAALDALEGPRCGDWVDFADGVTRRISYIWGNGEPRQIVAPEDEAWGGVQTSDGGSFYLGDGYVSFSGSLYHTVPWATLTRTDEQRPGRVWIFHHDWWTAHNGVDASIPFRVYTCSLPAPR